MMTLTRREMLAFAATAAVAAPSRPHGLKIGVTDWNLNMTGRVAALAFAKRIGFAGVQVSLGITPVDGHLMLADRKVQLNYQSESQKLDFPITSTCLDILHVNYLKNDKLGQQWVREGIAATSALEVEVMLLPFFGKGAIETRQEQDAVADILAELGPEAAKAKVVLGIENTISAEDNVRILERAKSKAVRVYYDTGNSFAKGFDVYREIRTLTAKRICQIHLKDNPNYLGEGKIEFDKVMRSIADAGYKQWAVLETDSPSHNIEGDMKRNLTYIQRLLLETPKG
jgi:L-ribulose-5-phosphate 3-epimerase